MTMTFEAPTALAGPEADTQPLAVFNGDADESKSETVASEEATEPNDAEWEVNADSPEEATQEDASPEAIEQANADLAEAAEDEPDDTFFEELELLGEIAEAERQCQKLESRLFVINEDRKEVKKAYEVAILNVREAASRLSDLLGDKKLPAKPKPVAVGSVEPVAGEATADDDAWRDLPTRELLVGIKGMGDKKLDAICELAKTVGDLEDLRAEAGLSHKPFKDVLPQGFGEKVASAIEDRLIEHIAKTSAPRCADQVEPRVEPASEVDDEDAEKPIRLFGSTDDAATKIAITKEFDEYRKQLEKDNDFDELKLEECDVCDTDPAVLVDGYKAYEDNEPVHACPENTADGQNDWVYGWCLAKAKERLLAAAEADEDDEADDE